MTNKLGVLWSVSLYLRAPFFFDYILWLGSFCLSWNSCCQLVSDQTKWIHQVLFKRIWIHLPWLASSVISLNNIISRQVVPNPALPLNHRGIWRALPGLLVFPSIGLVCLSGFWKWRSNFKLMESCDSESLLQPRGTWLPVHDLYQLDSWGQISMVG
jgi:hypothetical protein